MSVPQQKVYPIAEPLQTLLCNCVASSLQQNTQQSVVSVSLQPSKSILLIPLCDDEFSVAKILVERIDGKQLFEFSRYIPLSDGREVILRRKWRVTVAKKPTDGQQQLLAVIDRAELDDKFSKFFKADALLDPKQMNAYELLITVQTLMYMDLFSPRVLPPVDSKSELQLMYKITWLSSHLSGSSSSAAALVLKTNENMIQRYAILAAMDFVRQTAMHAKLGRTFDIGIQQRYDLREWLLRYQFHAAYYPIINSEFERMRVHCEHYVRKFIDKKIQSDNNKMLGKDYIHLFEYNGEDGEEGYDDEVPLFGVGYEPVITVATINQDVNLARELSKLAKLFELTNTFEEDCLDETAQPIKNDAAVADGGRKSSRRTTTTKEVIPMPILVEVTRTFAANTGNKLAGSSQDEEITRLVQQLNIHGMKPEKRREITGLSYVEPFVVELFFDTLCQSALLTTEQLETLLEIVSNGRQVATLRVETVATTGSSDTMMGILAALMANVLTRHHVVHSVKCGYYVKTDMKSLREIVTEAISYRNKITLQVDKSGIVPLNPVSFLASGSINRNKLHKNLLKKNAKSHLKEQIMNHRIPSKSRLNVAADGHNGEVRIKLEEEASSASPVAYFGSHRRRPREEEEESAVVNGALSQQEIERLRERHERQHFVQSIEDAARAEEDARRELARQEAEDNANDVPDAAVGPDLEQLIREVAWPHERFLMRRAVHYYQNILDGVTRVYRDMQRMREEEGNSTLTDEQITQQMRPRIAEIIAEQARHVRRNLNNGDILGLIMVLNIIYVNLKNWSSIREMTADYGPFFAIWGEDSVAAPLANFITYLLIAVGLVRLMFPYNVLIALSSVVQDAMTMGLGTFRVGARLVLGQQRFYRASQLVSSALRSAGLWSRDAINTFWQNMRLGNLFARAFGVVSGNAEQQNRPESLDARRALQVRRFESNAAAAGEEEEAQRNAQLLRDQWNAFYDDYLESLKESARQDASAVMQQLRRYGSQFVSDVRSLGQLSSADVNELKEFIQERIRNAPQVLDRASGGALKRAWDLTRNGLILLGSALLASFEALRTSLEIAGTTLGPHITAILRRNLAEQAASENPGSGVNEADGDEDYEEPEVLPEPPRRRQRLAISDDRMMEDEFEEETVPIHPPPPPQSPVATNIEETSRKIKGRRSGRRTLGFKNRLSTDSNATRIALMQKFIGSRMLEPPAAAAKSQLECKPGRICMHTVQ